MCDRVPLWPEPPREEIGPIRTWALPSMHEGSGCRALWEPTVHKVIARANAPAPAKPQGSETRRCTLVDRTGQTGSFEHRGDHGTPRSEDMKQRTVDARGDCRGADRALSRLAFGDRFAADGLDKALSAPRSWPSMDRPQAVSLFPNQFPKPLDLQMGNPTRPTATVRSCATQT